MSLVASNKRQDNFNKRHEVSPCALATSRLQISLVHVTRNTDNKGDELFTWLKSPWNAALTRLKGVVGPRTLQRMSLIPRRTAISLMARWQRSPKPNRVCHGKRKYSVCICIRFGSVTTREGETSCAYLQCSSRETRVSSLETSTSFRDDPTSPETSLDPREKHLFLRDETLVSREGYEN